MSDTPLAGFRVVVTRPVAQAHKFATAIENAGGEAIRLPVISISGRAPNEVAAAFGAMPTPDVIIFVSPNAVEFGLPSVRDCSAVVAAIGPATAAAVKALGKTVDISPDTCFDSEHLLEHPAMKEVAGKNVTIVRGQTGREILASTLVERSADVNYLPVYRRELNRPPESDLRNLDRAWRNNRIGAVTVMSVETLENLLKILPPTSLRRLRHTPLVAPSERVIQTALEQLPGIPAILATGPRETDMLNALVQLRHSGIN